MGGVEGPGDTAWLWIPLTQIMWIVFTVCGCNHKVFIYVCSGGHIAQFMFITPQSTFVDCWSGESAVNALSGYLPQSPGICSWSYVPSQSKCMQMILQWWDLVVSILSRCSHGCTKWGLDVLFILLAEFQLTALTATEVEYLAMFV